MSAPSINTARGTWVDVGRTFTNSRTDECVGISTAQHNAFEERVPRGSLLWQDNIRNYLERLTGVRRDGGEWVESGHLFVNDKTQRRVRVSEAEYQKLQTQDAADAQVRLAELAKAARARKRSARNATAEVWTEIASITAGRSRFRNETTRDIIEVSEAEYKAFAASAGPRNSEMWPYNLRNWLTTENRPILSRRGADQYEWVGDGDDPDEDDCAEGREA